LEDNTPEIEQQLAEKEQAVQALQRQLAGQEQFLDRAFGDYNRLRLDHGALSENVEALQEQLAQVNQERAYLRQNLARFEQDLRALQNTRTVRATRLAGQVFGSLKSKVEGRKSKVISHQPPAASRQPVTPSTQHSALSTQHSALNYEGWFWERYSLDAALNAQVWDFSRADLEESRAVQLGNPGPLELKSLVWFLPPFQHAFYGGIHTILRFAAYFKEAKGVSNRFVVVRPQATTPQAIARAIASAFPVLQDAPVTAVENYDDLDKVEAADGAVATLWNTAYYALRFNRTRRKFYFIQDYEPLFYPAGTSYALAEAPYRFGFYGLTNTVSLRDLYCQQYGGQAEYFTPAVNTKIFNKDEVGKDEVGRMKDEENPETSSSSSFILPTSSLFFYARPGAPRNAFELGTTALRKLKSRMGERVRIVSAGADWSPAQYGLEGIVENLGLLGYEETAALYRTCDVGLVMMFTRHPSYLPFELMASGCLVVTNENPATRWLLRDGENCLLSAPSASALAETLERGLTDSSLRNTITATALTEIQANYADWDSQMEKIFRYMENPGTS
jgi:glycosyltransferase involved in cell wall biosynthesis